MTIAIALFSLFWPSAVLIKPLVQPDRSIVIIIVIGGWRAGGS